MDRRGEGPGKHAGQTGDFALVFDGQLLAQRVVAGKHPERAHAYDQQDREERPAFGQEKHGGGQGRQNRAAQIDQAPRSMHREAAPPQPKRQRAGAKAADVRRHVKQRIEIERLAFGVTAALLQDFRQPGAQQLPAGVDTDDDHDEHQETPAEQNLAESRSARKLARRLGRGQGRPAQVGFAHQ